MLGFYLIASASPALFNLRTEQIMTDKLLDHELRILNALEEDRGRLTRAVALIADVIGFNGHQQSGAARAYLMSLRKRGLVDFYDNDKPILWKRTAAGTAAISAAKLKSPKGDEVSAED